MGSLILSAGETGMRYSLPNSRIMVHHHQVVSPALPKLCKQQARVNRKEKFFFQLLRASSITGSLNECIVYEKPYCCLKTIALDEGKEKKKFPMSINFDHRNYIKYAK